MRRARDLKRGDVIEIDGTQWQVASAFVEGRGGPVDLGLFNEHFPYSLHLAGDHLVEVLDEAT